MLVWVLGGIGVAIVLGAIMLAIGLSRVTKDDDVPPLALDGTEPGESSSEHQIASNGSIGSLPGGSPDARQTLPPKSNSSEVEVPNKAVAVEQDTLAKARERAAQMRRELAERVAASRHEAETKLEEHATRPANSATALSSNTATGYDRSYQAQDEPSANPELPNAAPVVWQATPDPASHVTEIKRGRISIDIPTSAKILFPRNPSNFVLVSAGSFRDETKQVYDLRTGGAIGKPVKCGLDVQSFEQAFSPDGRYYSNKLHVSGATAYGIWSFVDGDMLREVSIADGSRGGIHFGATHQLVIFSTHQAKSPEIELMDLRSGEVICKFEIRAKRFQFLDDDSTAISNGGRYFVALLNRTFVVYELASGQLMGEGQLPGDRFSCEGLAFSHDGEQLAIIGSESGKSRLFCVDFSTGQIELDTEYGSRLSGSSQGHPLEFLPDGSALLYRGTLLLDRRTGAELWTFPQAGNSSRRILRAGKMLVSMRRGGKRTDVLTEVDLPEKALAAAADAIHGGGEAIDAALPPLTTADTFGANQVTLPNGFIPWSASPDPAPAVKSEIDRAIAIASERDSLQSVRFAGRGSGKVLIHLRVNGQQDALEQVDLNNGSKSKPMPIPNVYKMLDVSPSGDAALIGFEEGSRNSNKGFSRIDLVKFRPNEHIAGWRPHAAEASPTGDEGHVAWATFLTDDQVATVNKSGKLTLWQLPDCKAVYQFEQFGEPLAVSPGRKYFAGVHEGGFRVFDAATGKCAGDLESPKTGLNALRAAFDSEGESLAAIIETNMDRLLVRWDMNSGKLIQEFPVKSELLHALGRGWFGREAGLEWRGDRYLMLDAQYLIDLENEAVVWRYHMPGSYYAAGSPDGRTWLAGRQHGAGGPWFLKAHETPSLIARGKTVLMNREKQLVLAPGMKVRIHVDLSSVGLQNMASSVTEALADAFATRDIQQDQSSATVFSLVAAKKATGGDIAVTEGRSSRVAETFSAESLAVNLTLYDSTRKPRWRSEKSVQMRTYGTVRSDTDARSQLAKEMYEAFKRMLTTGGLATEGVPTYIFADLEEMLAGESSLTFSGEGPPPTRSKSSSSSL
ncbi:MAG: hypothetical protein H6822_29600 [Planctomycetaceae bacterium]|nr:hypothetical protein [Planctomycetales bacterium]MCB9926339.1 hypothetical protein [Planctomycetaceae bacterium]